MPNYRRVASLTTPEAFREHLLSLGADLPFDSELQSGQSSPLAQPLETGIKTVGNRFSILPMEGWDGQPDGNPSELTIRRWRRFGSSGAKLISGGEAVAVRADGRANPNQLIMTPETIRGIASLREALLEEHAQCFSNCEDVLIGLQLTHSGRFSRPTRDGWQSRTVYAHPILDQKFQVKPDAILSDIEIDELIECYGSAAALARQAGFEYVDLKHCHGYLGHEFLSAHDRSGRYGGSFENRTRFLVNLVEKVRQRAPGLALSVRLSAFDFVPFAPGPASTDSRVGQPVLERGSSYRYAFGGDGTGTGIDLNETHQLLELLERLGIRLVSLTAGSPYYVPHIQRPALFPPSDGYLPPEDPLVGVARQVHVAAELKRAHPNLFFIGAGYSYLQEWLPHVGQYLVREGMIDFVGLGRMVLSYPQLPHDVLQGEPIKRKLICRTFSDCTTAPRNGLVSGCFPLDPFYKAHPDRAQLKALKGNDA